MPGRRPQGEEVEDVPGRVDLRAEDAVLAEAHADERAERVVGVGADARPVPDRHAHHLRHRAVGRHGALVAEDRWQRRAGDAEVVQSG